MGGFGRFRGRPVCVLGQEKGSTTETRLRHNFGMAKPEGYRKAVRLMELADRFGLPVLAFVDTAGAFPGIEAEERGQAEAIARSTEACLALGVPNVAVVIGEGGSGGAIALATANRVLMLEHAIYGVISPEGAASILWRDQGRASDAATAMKITAQDLLRLGIIDGIVPEATGGAHRGREAAIDGDGGRHRSRPGGVRGARPGRDPGPARGEVPGDRSEALRSRHSAADRGGNQWARRLASRCQGFATSTRGGALAKNLRNQSVSFRARPTRRQMRRDRVDGPDDVRNPHPAQAAAAVSLR